MTIKDFTVGQTAYVYSTDKRDNPEKGYREVTVKKVGRVYVTVGGRWETKYEVGYNDEGYLVEAGNYASYLFRTKQDLDDYFERQHIIGYLRAVFEWSSITKLSLAQLRAVKKIIDGEESA